MRRKWLPEAGFLLCVAVLATVVFAVVPLDLSAARIFYRPQGTDHWPFAAVLPSTFLYQLAPVITASLLVFSLLGLLISQLNKRETWRRNCILLIFSILIGPGLLVNAVFKDHWHRPRPREVVEFGGSLQYTPAPWRGEGGSSFPCGHCSVGFMYAAGWWMWKHKRRGWARASLVLGLTLGSALGVGRMAAGAHFLSDVIWSALIALGMAHVLYEHVLPLAESYAAIQRIPKHHPRLLRGKYILTIFAFGGASLALIALFVTPHGKPFSLQVDLASLSRAPRVLEVVASAANVDIVIENSQQTQMLAEGELHGFGLPGGRLETATAFHEVPIPALSFRIEEQGWITDLSAFTKIRVPLGNLQCIVVRLDHGDIHVTDATGERAVHNDVLKLDLQTHSGRVQVSE